MHQSPLVPLLIARFALPETRAAAIAASQLYAL